jgi:TonB family protein
MRKRPFSLFLLLVLTAHLGLLMSQLRPHLQKKLSEKQPSPLNIQLTQKSKEFLYKRQIVQSENRVDDEVPLKTRFLSDRNRHFTRETVARRVDRFRESGGGESTKKLNKELSLSNLGAFPKEHRPWHPKAEEKRKSLSSTNDDVERIPLGDLTSLNTAEYKYYGFYHRIRQRLEQFWGQNIFQIALKLLKQGRRLATQDRLLTSLVVTLDAAGDITSVEIKGASGVSELDTAAVESFNQAGPFPNPPKGLVQNGEVRIEWGFVVKPI